MWSLTVCCGIRARQYTLTTQHFVIEYVPTTARSIGFYFLHMHALVWKASVGWLNIQYYIWSAFSPFDFLIYLRPHNGCWGIQQAVIQISAELFNQCRPSVCIRSTPGSKQSVPVLTAAHHPQPIQDHMHNTDSQVSVYQVKYTLLLLWEFPHASTMACLAEFTWLA